MPKLNVTGAPPPPPPMNRWAQLKSERSTWDAHAKDLAQFLLPRSSLEALRNAQA